MIQTKIVCDLCLEEIEGDHISIGSQESCVQITFQTKYDTFKGTSFHFCGNNCLKLFLVKDQTRAKMN